MYDLEGVAYNCLKKFVERRLDYYQNYFDGDVILHDKYAIVTDKYFVRYQDRQIKKASQIVELFKDGPQNLSITNKQRQWLEVELREWLYYFRHLIGELGSGGNDAVNDVLHWLASYRQCRCCKKTKSVSEFEVPAPIEIHTYRLPWLKMELSRERERCREKSGEIISSHIVEDKEERVLWRNQRKIVGDILGIDMIGMDIEPEYDFDTVRIPVNDDQREWLRLHFLNYLRRLRKLLNEGRKKMPTYYLYIAREEGNIDMIKYLLRMIKMSEDYMCKDCISRPPPDYEGCEREASKRPEVREWSSKEKNELT